MNDQRAFYNKEKEEWKAGHAAENAKHFAKEAELGWNLAKAEVEKRELKRKVNDMVYQLEGQSSLGMELIFSFSPLLTWQKWPRLLVFGRKF